MSKTNELIRQVWMQHLMRPIPGLSQDLNDGSDQKYLALLEAGTELKVIDVYGLSFPTPYPTNRPTAPPIEPAVSCILSFGRNWPAMTSAAEIANNKRAVTSTASSDLLFSGLAA